MSSAIDLNHLSESGLREDYPGAEAGVAWRGGGQGTRWSTHARWCTRGQPTRRSWSCPCTRPVCCAATCGAAAGWCSTARWPAPPSPRCSSSRRQVRGCSSEMPNLEHPDPFTRQPFNTPSRWGSIHTGLSQLRDPYPLRPGAPHSSFWYQSISHNLYTCSCGTPLHRSLGEQPSAVYRNTRIPLSTGSRHMGQHLGVTRISCTTHGSHAHPCPHGTMARSLPYPAGI